MSNPVLDLTNPTKWSLTYTNHIEAPVAPGGGWYGINPFYAPIVFNSQTLVFAVESEWARSHWWLGCRIQQIIDAPGTDFDEIPASRRSLPINRSCLVQFPKLAGQYRIRFEVPYWHKNLNITIWEYTGTSGDSTEELLIGGLDALDISLDRVEGKIDILIGL